MDNRTIVITLYGTGKAINDFTVTLFDENRSSWSESNANDYCSNINGLELKDDKWIYAFTVKDNQKIKVEDPRKIDFDIISALDDSSIQKVLRQVDNHELAQALKSTEQETLKAVLRNMSKRAAKLLIENMKYMGPVSSADVNEARRKIVSIIRHLEDTGTITVQRSRPDGKDKNS